MSTSTTRYLGLKVDSDLTASAKYNLAKLDLLGAVLRLSAAQTLTVAGPTDVLVEPQAQGSGGVGTGGTLTLGHEGNDTATIRVRGALNLSQAAGLLDQGAAGTKYLRLKYNSTLAGSVDTTADRALSIDPQGADRQLVLAGNVSLAGSLTTTGAFSLALALSQSGSFALPNQASATLVSRDSTDTFTGKTYDADGAGNALSNVRDANVAAGAAIARSKLASGTADHVLINSGAGAFSSEAQLARTRGGTGVSSTATYPSSGVVATDVNTLTFSAKSIDGDTNTLTNVRDAAVASNAAIARSKLASGSASHVLINNGAGAFSSEAQLAVTRGGTGQTGTAQYPTSGTVATDSNVLVFTNKSIDALNNPVTNLANASIAASAAIARSKLASGSGGHVLINAGDGSFSSEAQLARTRGGTGVSSTATFPTSGVVVTRDAAETLTNKSMDASSNTFTNLGNSAVAAAAAIALTKLAALSASIVPVTNGSGFLTSSAVTATQLGYLSGVSSALQTQLDAKAARDLTNLQLTGLAAGDMVYATGTTTLARLAKGTNGQALLMAGGVPTWGAGGGGGGGAVVVYGSSGTPLAVVAATSIAVSTTDPHQSRYVKGVGGVVSTATPQVQAGGIGGQRLTLLGTSGVDFVRLHDGDGLKQNGPIVLGAGCSITYEWDADALVWRELSRVEY